MTLPLSGPISIAEIANEVGVPTNTSLRNLSNAAGFGTPDSFSEFYGYPPSPTPSPTPSITPTPSVTPSSTPPVSPSPTPSTTPAASSAPSPTPSPTPSVTPSPTPSTTPAASSAPSPTPSPSPLPSYPSFSSSTTETFGSVCSAGLTQTYYFNGTGSVPEAGDTVYSDSAGTTLLDAGYYLLNTGNNIQVGGTGNVIITNPCGAGGA